MCLPPSTCHDSVLASPEMSWRRTEQANGRKPRGPARPPVERRDGVERSGPDPDLSYLNGSSLSAPESTNYSLGASIYSIHSRDNMPWGTWRDHSLTKCDRTETNLCAHAPRVQRAAARQRASLRLRSAVSCSGLVGATLGPVVVQQSAPGSQVERVSSAPGHSAVRWDMGGRGREMEIR